MRGHAYVHGDTTARKFKLHLLTRHFPQTAAVRSLPRARGVHTSNVIVCGRIDPGKTLEQAQEKELGYLDGEFWFSGTQHSLKGGRAYPFALPNILSIRKDMAGVGQTGSL